MAIFNGSGVALVTPMTTSRALDFPAISELIEWHLSESTDAIVLLGSTGEAATILPEERAALIRHAVAAVAGRVPIIVGTGSNSTRLAIRQTQEAIECGADACLVVTPYYNRPTQEGLYEHFRLVAESSRIPLILYNVPSRTGVDMLPETVARLQPIKNIIGLKEAVATTERMRQLRDCCGGQFALYSGDDATANEAIAHGFTGVISVAANIIPLLMHQLCYAALDGILDEALSIQQQLQPLFEALAVETNPIPVKWALHRMGLIDEGIRLPLTPLSLQYHEALTRILVQLNALELSN